MKIDTIDQFLVNKYRKERKLTSHWPTNSSAIIDGKIIGKCLRAQYYAWIEQPITNMPDIDTLWRFQMGNAFELILGKILKEMEGAGIIKDLRTQTRIEIKHPRLKHSISGRVDFEYVCETKREVIEAKSTYGRSFTDPIEGIKYAGPMKHHILQIQCYIRSKIAHYYYILYFARDTGWREMFEELNSPESDKIWDSIIDRWHTLEMNLEAGKIPSRDFTLQYSPEKCEELWKEYRKTTHSRKPLTLKAFSKDRGNWQCKNCEYKNLCWEIKNG